MKSISDIIALKERSNEALNRLTEGARYSCSGTFESILDSRRCKKGFYACSQNNDKETRIYPNIPLIQKESKQDRLKTRNMAIEDSLRSKVV